MAGWWFQPTPLKNIHQLGSWHSQLNGKVKFMFQSPPSRWESNDTYRMKSMWSKAVKLGVEAFKIWPCMSSNPGRMETSADIWLIGISPFPQSNWLKQMRSFWTGRIMSSSKCGKPNNTWWLIPLSKWVITPVIRGLTLLIPFITGLITHLWFVGWATK